ncbi:MAG: aspartate--tRNA ligase [Planctomycetota bacterium]|nr:MAG: aspartate--tRNA ligase [Planctomycetota bacterium]
MSHESQTPSFSTTRRDASCGELRRHDAGRRVRLCGWVDRRRDHGGLLFVDLRDRWGRTQLVFDPDRLGAEVFAEAGRLRAEDVIAVEGAVRERPEEARSDKLATGEIEVHVERLELLNRAETPPFPVSASAREGDDVAMETRMRYRHIDLRRPVVQQRLIFRHRVVMALRQALDALGFVEIETPILTRSTPEGARDYLVPSRLQHGSFYALPQSPQLFKQLLMVAGYDRYFQVARCFRDEDLRADRQPEFTQLDLEMSFVDEEDIYRTLEQVLAEVWQRCKGVQLERPFARLRYDEAIARYGSDRPDLRNPLEIRDVTDVAARSPFGFLAEAAAAPRTRTEPGGAVRALRVPGAADRLSRKELDALGELVAPTGAKGVGWIKVAEGGELRGALRKGFPDALGAALRERLEAQPGDLVLVVADRNADVAAAACGRLRETLGRQLGLVDTSADRLVWITDFPYFEYDPETDGYIACRHPFTQPAADSIDRLEDEPLAVRTRAYDLVLNGSEIGSGSVRNHDVEIQKRVLAVMGYSPEESEQRFGFLMEALRSGAPPHAGAAIGLDRFCALLLGLDNLREVVAFPKTTRASCLLTHAPAPVDPAQLAALGLRIRSDVSVGE